MATLNGKYDIRKLYTISIYIILTTFQQIMEHYICYTFKIYYYSYDFLKNIIYENNVTNFKDYCF